MGMKEWNEMSLFIFRFIEIGLSIFEPDLPTIGTAFDIWTEKSNSGVRYGNIAG